MAGDVVLACDVVVTRVLWQVMLYYVVTDPHGVLNGLSQVSYHLVGFEVILPLFYLYLYLCSFYLCFPLPLFLCGLLRVGGYTGSHSLVALSPPALWRIAFWCACLAGGSRRLAALA